MELFLFVDWMMELSEALKREFKTELEQYEQEKQMRYVSSIKEITIEETRIKMALKLLQKGMSVEDIVLSTKLSISEVERFANEQVQNLQSWQQ
jgi:predicted transposase YdaD